MYFPERVPQACSCLLENLDNLDTFDNSDKLDKLDYLDIKQLENNFKQFANDMHIVDKNIKSYQFIDLCLTHRTVVMF